MQEEILIPSAVVPMVAIAPPSSFGGIDDVVIVGGGIAGLLCALRLAPRPVTILAESLLSEDADGGVAAWGHSALIGLGDSTDNRIADIVAAGAGLAEERIARSVMKEAPERIRDLIGLGIGFGDGATPLMAALVAAVRQTPSIRVMEGYVAERLRLDGERNIVGLVVRDRRGGLSNRLRVPTRAVVLASGGVAHLYAGDHRRAVSDGIALAARAGALIADPEFVQFDAGTPTNQIGGVHVDATGRTTLDGLWTCGEAAATGMHGATILPGHPLLETIVFADRIAKDIRSLLPTSRITRLGDPGEGRASAEADADGELMSGLRAAMTRHVGAVRDHAGLTEALRAIDDLSAQARMPETENALATAKLVTTAALLRKETRGVHVRSDFPTTDPRRASRTFVTLEATEASAARAIAPLALAS